MLRSAKQGTVRRITMIPFEVRFFNSIFDYRMKISVGCKAGSTATTRQKVLLDDSGDQPHVKDNEAMTDENKIVQPSRLELENVHKVYNEIANHFSLTRHTPWPQVRTFIEEFDVGSVLVDIGCGNGKYLHLNENIAKVARHAATE